MGASHVSVRALRGAPPGGLQQLRSSVRLLPLEDLPQGAPERQKGPEGPVDGIPGIPDRVPQSHGVQL